MLVLTRRIGEEIVIGEQVHLKILSVDGRRVRTRSLRERAGLRTVA